MHRLGTLPLVTLYSLWHQRSMRAAKHNLDLNLKLFVTLFKLSVDRNPNLRCRKHLINFIYIIFNSTFHEWRHLVETNTTKWENNIDKTRLLQIKNWSLKAMEKICDSNWSRMFFCLLIYSKEIFFCFEFRFSQTHGKNNFCSTKIIWSWEKHFSVIRALIKEAAMFSWFYIVNAFYYFHKIWNSNV